jgi:sigma-B regulation protein RsbU (phosphoserine phosphatase)
VNSVKIFDTGYAFLITKNGAFITSPDQFRSRIMNETMFTISKETNAPELRELGRKMIHGETGFTSLGYDERGKLWFYYLPQPSTKWSLGVIFPDKEMYADLIQLNVFVTLVSVLGLILLVILTIRIIRKLTNPLSQFSKSAQVIAMGNFNAELPEVQTNDEMKELHDSFDYMQKELSNYVTNLKETTSAKEKIESELRIAKEIQLGMIPHIFPPFPHLKEIDLYASLVSAREVGGDLYDFFLLDENLLCFAIGDVSGKGVPSSLFMAVTRTLLRSIADKDKNTAEIVSSINKTLSINNESNMFVTFFLGIIDTKKGLLKFCNAGHNPPILIRGGEKAEYFNFTKTIPVGLFDTIEYKEETTNLNYGDQIFLYTDGVTEAEDINNNLYGNDQLLKVINENASASPRELIELVNNDIAGHVNGHIQSDDLTMMSIIYYERKK